MKHIVFTFALLVGCLSSSFAQHYTEDFEINKKGENHHFGKNVKMVYSAMLGTTLPALKIDDERVDMDQPMGFLIGMRWGVDLGRVEIVPEVWFENNNFSFADNSIANGAEIHTKSLEFPIIIGVRLIDQLRLNMGPSFMLYNQTKATTLQGEEYEVGRLKSTTGYALGFSYVGWGHFIFDARYVGRFASSSSSLNDGGSMVDVDAYTYNFAIGYKF